MNHIIKVWIWFHSFSCLALSFKIFLRYYFRSF